MKRSITVMPPGQPILHTPRLLLRAFTMDDAPALIQVAKDFEVADTTLAIAHPFDEKAAQEWLQPLHEYDQLGLKTTWAITQRSTQVLMGMVSLMADPHNDGVLDLGYWLGVAYWGQGYATEATRAVVDFAFQNPRCERLQAYHFTRNIGSRKVLLKLGFQYEGQRQAAIRKWGRLEDIQLYGLLRKDFFSKLCL